MTEGLDMKSSLDDDKRILTAQPVIKNNSNIYDPYTNEAKLKQLFIIKEGQTNILKNNYGNTSSNNNRNNPIKKNSMLLLSNNDSEPKFHYQLQNELE